MFSAAGGEPRRSPRAQTGQTTTSEAGTDHTVASRAHTNHMATSRAQTELTTASRAQTDLTTASRAQTDHMTAPIAQTDLTTGLLVVLSWWGGLGEGEEQERQCFDRSAPSHRQLRRRLQSAGGDGLCLQTDHSPAGADGSRR